MKKFYLFLILSILCCNGFSQKLKDRFEYKVTYKLTYAQDSTALDEPASEYMILFTGDELSKFSSRAVTLKDIYEINGNSGRTSPQAISEFHYQILKQPKEGRLLYTLKIPKMDDRFYYVEELDQFDWQILPETKTIEDFEVQKATTSFRGRDYVAWFAPEIPVSDGPYKFNGLPGLILEIADTEQDWNFEFFGLERLLPTVSYKTNLRMYAKTNREELLALWKRYRNDPFTYAGQASDMDPEIHKEYARIFSEKERKKNNPIELE